MMLRSCDGEEPLGGACSSGWEVRWSDELDWSRTDGGVVGTFCDDGVGGVMAEVR